MCLEDESVVSPSSFPMRERTSPRHPSFDYRSIAAYFVTTCTKDRRCLFGEVCRGRVLLNDVGRIVMEEWKRSEKLRERILLDAWIVMPNHMHGIVCIVPPETKDVSPRGYDLQVGRVPTRSVDAPTRDERTTRASSLPQDGNRSAKGPPAKSLSAMVGAFKSSVSRRVNQYRKTAEDTIWQSRFHDRIIRNEREWRARRRYIERNPERWEQDPYRAPA